MEKDVIVLRREYKGVIECSLCKGVCFIFDEEFISFELLNEEEKKK